MNDWSQQYKQGQRRLRQLLPWARAEAEKPGSSVEARSPLGATTMPWATEDNLDALLIHPAPKGGWHADLVLKWTPPGTPNCLGSPVHSPHKTKPEAEQAAKGLLVAVLAAAKNAAVTEPPPPAFILHSCSFRLDPLIYEIALTAFPERANGYGTTEAAIAKVEEVEASLFPRGFTLDAFNALAHGDKASLLTVLHLAALTGLYVYPPRRDASPSGHEAPPETPH